MVLQDMSSKSSNKADIKTLISASQKLVAAVNAAGGHAKLTLYPGVGYDSWTATYANPEIYEWLLAQRRSPAKVAP